MDYKCEDCQVRDILTDEDKQGNKLVYGKKMLTSHRPYGLWNEETDTFDEEKMSLLYQLYVANISKLRLHFKHLWVKPDQILTTTKHLIWDWTNDEEFKRNAEDMNNNGMYFPIFTLDKGLLHNQIISKKEKEELASLGLYNTYNGNHRAEIQKYLVQNNYKDKDHEVLIVIIPEFCQKSCTGFKYDLIDDTANNHPLTKYTLDESLLLFNLDYLDSEMKISNWENKIELLEGVSLVNVRNYNLAFRIITSFQNCLEAPLVRYFELYKDLPKGIKSLMPIFNDKKEYDAFFE